MAHTKAAGSTKLGRDSAGKRLGVKTSGGTMVKNGNIIVRQRGTRFEVGAGTAMGTDQTIYAIRAGIVNFTTKQVTKFSGQKVRRKFVSVEPAAPVKEPAK
ncbi:MAG TPA: 50S ribosomal protein L27 [Candidatus Dormibacteraeota bacterium]|nr:50S ribosomal protein L27 [Candidatus Dormibacteraeota bacterium]